MKIELRQIRQFMAVAQALSFRRAAEHLAIAQPALSRGIQALEHQLGVTLLLRNNRRVELTEAGKVFLKGCHALKGHLDETVRQTRYAQDGLLGSLAIGYTDFAISGTLPSLLDGFRRNHPEVGLDLIYDATPLQLDQLTTGRLDVGFLTGPVISDEFATVPVQSDKFVAVLPANHPLAEHSAIELRALANEPFIFGITARWEHFRRHVDALCLKAGFAPKVAQEAYNTEGMFGLVSANIGVTIHLECAANHGFRGVAIRPLADVHDPIVTVAAWRPTNMNAVVSRFVDFLHAQDREKHAAPT